jgi:formylglycine-generating enzyme required for sulfatase activity
MVRLPTGRFQMGATEDDKFANLLERPAHTVVIDHPVALGRYPVTVGDWQRFAVTRADVPQPGDIHILNQNDQQPDLPMLGVSWADALAYCRWLSEQTGEAYRLPTEAEWEYAARAGTDQVFAAGSTLGLDQANYLFNEIGEQVGVGHPTPVGQYEANAFGLSDMHGNVAELVMDHWHDGYVGAPTDGRAWIDPDQQDTGLRVLRGGSWDHLPRLLRCAYRDWIAWDKRQDNVGFRVAKDLARGTAMDEIEV